MMKKISIVAIIIIVAGFFAWWQFKKEAPAQVTNFEECVVAGNPVMESYPRQCRHDNQTFTEEIGNELEKTDLIRLDAPRPNQVVSSPLIITGEARGYWFFEASFPVVLTDWDGRIIAQGIATANPPVGGDWMTSEFVPFEATLTFSVDKNVYSNRGSLILRKDNPSGLPEHDDALEIPVVFAESTGNTDALQWLDIKQAIANCEVESVWQTHDRTVGAKLKNGEELVAVEPKLDDVINLAIVAEPQCGKILMGTE